MNKSNYHSCAFFRMLFAINTSWNLNEHFRSASSCGGKKILQIKKKKIKVKARGIDGFRRVYGC